MDPTPLHQLAQWAEGTLLQGEGSRLVANVSTDSRKLAEGDLFVALRGDSFDGHNFLNQAAALGASGAIIDIAFEGELPGGAFAVIRVDDTVAALGRIAARYRATLPLKVIGITGSSGKTSTKDFTAAVLAKRYRVTKTQGNFNNHIGLPLTVLAATSADEVGVFEMGMNHPGEIAPLAAIAAPDVAIITNIGVAHIEFMGSREAIAQEKGMLAEALPPGGALLLNEANPYVDALTQRTPGATVLTGISPDARVRVRAEVLETLFDGTRFSVSDRDGAPVEVTLPVSGLHMVENALLALGAGVLLGVPLVEGALGLAESRLTKGRLERKSVAGIEFLDDSYNANPDSMKAALQTLASLPGEGARIAILGRMGELGVEAERSHRAVGTVAARAGIDRLITVGGEEAHWLADAAREAGLTAVEIVSDPTEAAHRLAADVRGGDLVLVKGSRAARMERLFEYPAFAPAEPHTT